MATKKLVNKFACKTCELNNTDIRTAKQHSNGWTPILLYIQSLVIGITTGYTWLTYCKCITGSVLWRWQYFSISATSTNPAIMEVHIEWNIYIITVNSAVNNNNCGWHWWHHLAITPCHRKTLTLSCPAVWSFLDVAVIIAPGCRAWTAMNHLIQGFISNFHIQPKGCNMYNILTRKPFTIWDN